MLTSKGASGVTGAGFITLAATLAAIPGNPGHHLAQLDRIELALPAADHHAGDAVADEVGERAASISAAPRSPGSPSTNPAGS
jgi:hypothetical protein